MVNKFCKKYLKAEETYFIVKYLTCSPDKASSDNLLPNLAYFQSLAYSTREHQLPWPMGFFL